MITSIDYFLKQKVGFVWILVIFVTVIKLPCSFKMSIRQRENDGKRNKVIHETKLESFYEVQTNLVI